VSREQSRDDDGNFEEKVSDQDILVYRGWHEGDIEQVGEAFLVDGEVYRPATGTG